MHRSRRRWLVPVAAPLIRERLDGRRRRARRDRRARRTRRRCRVAGRAAPIETLDLGAAVILPGLVNAHTHLELSHLAGAVAPADSFVVVGARDAGRALRRAGLGRQPSPTPSSRAIGQMEATGTAGVGDIGNTDVAVLPLAASSLSGVHFREALGVQAGRRRSASRARRAWVRCWHRRGSPSWAARGCVASVAPHAPYSTSAPLIQSLAPAAGTWLIGTSAGSPCRRFTWANRPRRWSSSRRAPARSAPCSPISARGTTRGCRPVLHPVAYLQQLGALHARLLVVHGTQFDAAELRTLADAGATLVLCPRSNRGSARACLLSPRPSRRACGGGRHRQPRQRRGPEPVRGTGVPARDRPEVPASRLLRGGDPRAVRGPWAARRWASWRPGATSRAIVRMPPAGVADVEEWLVADAADTGDLRWLDELVAQAVS